MSKRIAPIPSEKSETAVRIDNKHQHLQLTKYLPKFIDYALNYFSATKRDKAASLYSYLSTLSQDTGKRHLHVPFDRIKNDLNWSEPTVIKYRKILSEFGFIDGYRLNNNGLNSESRIDFIPEFEIDLLWLYASILDEEYECGCRRTALKYMERHLKKFSVVTKNKKYNNINKIKKAVRHLKKFSVREVLYTSLSITSRNGKNPLPGDKNKTSYSSIEGVPKNFLIQIKLLRRRLHKEFPTRYPTAKLTSKEIVDQANKLRICRDRDKYDWDTVLKPALDWAMDDPFWIQNLRSYSSLKSKWKNGDTKIQNLIVQWEKTAPTKPTKAKPIESYYSEAHLKERARKIVDAIDIQDHQVETLVKNIGGIEKYYLSIPKQFKKYSFFYSTHWEMISKYIWWLKEEVHFDNISPKLISTENTMFKKFLETWVKKDTTIRLSIRNGKYA